MTSIRDVPLHVFPLQIVAKLACLSKDMHMQSRKDASSRNKGLEVYRYLTSLGDVQAYRRVYTCMYNIQLWDIIETALRALKMPTNVYYIGCTDATRIMMYATGVVGESILYTCHYHVNVKSVNSILRDGLGVTKSPLILYKNLYSSILNVCTSLLRDHDQIDWESDSCFFYAVNLTHRKVYVTSYFNVDCANPELPDDVVLYEVSYIYLQYILTALVELKMQI
jgi:hypothetical protein